MQPNEELIADLAGAILDGAPIDWTAAESSSGLTDRPLLDQLRVLATVARLHRNLPRSDSITSFGRDTGASGDRAATLENWGHLRVLERIGRGAFGEVFRAWDMRLDREVALKLMPASADRDQRSSSIIEEGRLLARVRHPNVVTIYGADRIDDRIGLWMELVKGRTLQQATEQGRRFTARETAQIGSELCQAIDAVHSAGLLHRDIKPHNVMMADDGRVVLMDFGAGRELDDGQYPALAGTPLYLAPELLNGKEPTIRSDIYSLGVLLFYLLTGSYPVRAQSLRDLRLAHERREKLDVRTVRPDVPSRLARAIDRAIDPQPERRYDSAARLATELTQLAAPSKPGALAASVVLIMLATAVVAMRDWRSGPASTAARPIASGVSAVSHPIIVVLPFKNLNAEADSDYFADGLTDEVLRNLAVIRGLEVRSSTSSFAFRDKPRNLRDIGEQLGANLVVEGSVLRSGDRLRINAQLVQIAGDIPLWADRFDREMKDVLAIQDEISRAIVNRLRLTLGKGQRRYDVNPEAYALYLKARATVGRRGGTEALKAAEIFRQVVALDPSFAPAYGGLADAYAAGSMSIQGDLRPGSTLASGMSTEQAETLIRSAAETALRLDPLLAEAHAAMGLLHTREQNWQAADTAFVRAIELNPSLTGIQTNYAGSTLVPMGRLGEAVTLVQNASRIDPLSLDVRRAVATIDVLLGRYNKAIGDLLLIEAADPTFPYVDLLLARALTLAGRLPEAMPRWEGKDSPGRHHWMARALVMSGQRARVEKLAGEHEHPYRLTLIYAALGDTDRALEALDRAADLVPQRVGPLTMYPELAALREDPRFAAVRRKLGLP